MRHRSRLRPLLIAILSLAASVPPAPAATAGTTVEVTVTSLRSTKGKVVACLTSHARDFPKCAGTDVQEIRVAADSTELHFAFTGVAPGRYAIALLHDENGNGKMDKSMLLIPKEGYGFSRDAPVRMAPPKFDAAAFDVNGQTVRQVIRMRYMA